MNTEESSIPKTRVVYGISRWTNASRAAARHIDDGVGKPLCGSARKVFSWERDTDVPTCQKCTGMFWQKEAQKQTQSYWDCECETNYIHPTWDEECSVCGYEREGRPDSIVIEVLNAGLPLARCESSDCNHSWFSPQTSSIYMFNLVCETCQAKLYAIQYFNELSERLVA